MGLSETHMTEENSLIMPDYDFIQEPLSTRARGVGLLIRKTVQGWKRLDIKNDLIGKGRMIAIEIGDLAILQVYMPVSNRQWDEVRQHYEGIAAIMYRYPNKK